MVNDIMVNDHVGPKRNRLKVWESPLGQSPALKIGYMAWKNVPGLSRCWTRSLKLCQPAKHGEHQQPVARRRRGRWDRETASSKPILIAAFLAAEIAVAVLARFRVPQIPVLRGKPCAPVHAQGRSVSPDQIGAPNSWVR
jgi:hypothetical protein